MFKITASVLPAMLAVAAMVMTASLTVSTAQANKAIHDLMEDEIGPAFKVIGNDMKLGKITAQTKLAGKTLLNGFTALQLETPDKAPDGKGGERPITPEEVVIFKKLNADMLALVQVLVPQLDADDVAGAQLTVKKIVDVRLEAHDLFKAD